MTYISTVLATSAVPTYRTHANSRESAVDWYHLTGAYRSSSRGVLVYFG